ncbi:MAG: SapC family protein [Thermodesulfobacteriota bacterium]
MTQMMFYETIVRLDSTKHKDTRLTPVTNYAFAAGTNSIPIAGVEFIEASKEYPITFIKSNQGEYIPTVILGLQNDQNLFVDPNGQWTAQYIPAYVRRYPFVPATSKDPGKINICIDETYAGFGTDKGDPLFNEDKTPAPLLQNMVNFIQDYHMRMQHTNDFTRRLAACDLLQEMKAEFGNKETGKNFRLSGLHMIDEQKLLELDQEKVMDFFKKGEFAWIYSHLNSLSNFRRLLDRFFADRSRS